MSRWNRIVPLLVFSLLLQGVAVGLPQEENPQETPNATRTRYLQLQAALTALRAAEASQAAESLAEQYRHQDGSLVAAVSGCLGASAGMLATDLLRSPLVGGAAAARARLFTGIAVALFSVTAIALAKCVKIDANRRSLDARLADTRADIAGVTSQIQRIERRLIVRALGN